jgi:ATP synthase in type III secretion protein N
VPVADGTFVSLAQTLRGSRVHEAAVAVAAPVTPAPAPEPPAALTELVRDVRVLNARLAEAEAILAASRSGEAPAVPAPRERVALTEPFWTGIRALDGPLAFGRGARIGIFGPPGAGKSTLIDQLVSGSRADATVVALVGERGREAERWLRRIGASTSVVCATSDRSAVERLAAASRAFAQAAALRARGLHVLLVLDSLARVAAAARDLAVSAGEPVGRAGYPPSVTARLAALLECAGAVAGGSITLVATVLSDGPLEHDPVAEAARAALDGHVVLSSRLAAAGWFPAIDLPASASRTLADVATDGHRTAAARLRAAVAALDDSRDARALGLDPAAGDRRLARAIAAEERIARFLRQAEGGAVPAETLMEMGGIADSLDDGYLQ